MSVLPYATVAEFKAYPHDLALSAIRPGRPQAEQDAAVAQALARATADAVNYLSRDYAAAAVTRVLRVRVRADGILNLDLPEGRVTSVSAISVRAYPGDTPVALDVSGLIVGTSGRASVFASRYAAARVWLTVTYVAGYANTTLASPASASATSVTVTSPVGLVAGDVLYLDDPVAPERAIVSSTYVSGVSVPLVSPLAAAKASGAGASALPDDYRHAVILWAAGLLSRPSSGGAAAAEPFASATRSPGAPKASPMRSAGDSYIAQAQSILSSARRVGL